METMFVTAPDGVRIAYDVDGRGPGLLLLHGHAGSRQVWHTAGYSERLRTDFRVVTMDVRGHGESDSPRDPSAYAVNPVLADIASVADTCGFQQFCVWGYSFGGMIALRLAARTNRVSRVIIAGCSFGHTYTPELVERSIAQAQVVLAAKERGELETLPITPAQREVAEQFDISAHIACLRALPSWPSVSPRDVRCPALVFAGSEDGAVMTQLEAQRDEIAAAGHVLHVLPGLDHEGEIAAIETVLPVARSFLGDLASASS